jgi:hypothetical protein
LLTVEQHGPTQVATILDDSGNDEDLKVAWDIGGSLIVLAMTLDDEDDQVITLTSRQALLLRDLLNEVITVL